MRTERRENRLGLASAKAIVEQANAMHIFTDPRLNEARKVIENAELTKLIVEKNTRLAAEAKRSRKESRGNSADLITGFCGRRNMRCDRFIEPSDCTVYRNAEIRTKILLNQDCNLAMVNSYFGIMSKNGFIKRIY